MTKMKIKETELSETAAKRWQCLKSKSNQCPDLTIVIVNYNGSFWLKKTLETLAKNYLKITRYKVEVYVVDNNSTDDSLDFLRHQSVAKVIRNKENLGFAAANNIVLRKTTARYSMLLNSDVEFLPPPQSNLDKLVEFLDAHAKVGVITPFLRLTNGELDPASHRGEPTPWAAVSYFSGLEKLFPHQKFFSRYHQSYQSLDKIHMIEAVSGAAMMVRMTVVDKIGFLDERFFMYAEDLDWARRFRQAGYQVIFNPEVVLVHHKNKSGIENKSTKISQKTNRYFWDTMLQYYDKYYPRDYIMRFFLKVLIFIKKGGF